MEILTFRSMINTNRQLMHNLKNQHYFKICFILTFSDKLSFRKNLSINLVIKSKYGKGRSTTLISSAGLDAAECKFFLKKYLNISDLLKSVNSSNLKLGLFFKSSTFCLYVFVLCLTVLCTLNIKMSIYKVNKNAKILSCIVFYVFPIILL